MKTSIHPSYNQVTVTCNSCSNSFQTGSTNSQDIFVDSCNNCHPFFTGTQKIVDVANKAKDFEKRQETAKKLQEKIAIIKENKQKKLEEKSVSADQPSSLKDMIKMLKQSK
jgi:large subunit ribosomal protein L31